jgi:hypothetical protein
VGGDIYDERLFLPVVEKMTLRSITESKKAVDSWL